MARWWRVDGTQADQAPSGETPDVPTVILSLSRRRPHRRPIVYNMRLLPFWLAFLRMTFSFAAALSHFPLSHGVSARRARRTTDPDTSAPSRFARRADRAQVSAQAAPAPDTHAEQ